jgi:hypothetical protein
MKIFLKENAAEKKRVEVIGALAMTQVTTPIHQTKGRYRKFD